MPSADQNVSAGLGAIGELRADAVASVLRAHQPLAVLGGDGAAGRFLVEAPVQFGSPHELRVRQAG